MLMFLVLIEHKSAYIRQYSMMFLVHLELIRDQTNISCAQRVD